MPCNKLDYTKRIFDSIHGYINLTQIEQNIIDTVAFQRLHNIRQLGTAYLVYPTAQHSRFSHSLGVLHVVSEFIEALIADCPDSALFDSEKKIQEIRLAALLHDIGHHPFSHVIEDEVTELDGDEAKHTRLARHIMNSTSIKDEINSYDTKSIESMIMGTSRKRAYNSLISSDLDADRLDYLVRDSYFTGVAYGAIDIPRIMRIVRLVDNDVVYDMKGLPTIENYIMALMSMYWAVYYHKTITGFSLLLGSIYRELRNECLVPSYHEILEFDETDLYGYNDACLFNIVTQKSRESSRLGNMCKWFINRKQLKIVDDDRVYKRSKKGDEPPTRLSELWLESKSRAIAREANMSVDDIFLARRGRSFAKLTGDLILVYDGSTGEVNAINQIESSALSDFVGKSYIEERIYTTHIHYKDLKQVVSRHFGKHKSSQINE